MVSFYCPVEYDPDRQYTKQEMINVIMPHRELLCFFAQAAGYRHCVLGLDFDQYDPTDWSVPVFVMEAGEAKELLQVHGRRFKRAYDRSRPGKSLVVTFTSVSVSGWFQMGWELNPEHVFVG